MALQLLGMSKENVWVTVCTFYKTDAFSPHCAIMRFFHRLCDRMWQEVNCAKSHQHTISEALFLIFKFVINVKFLKFIYM